MPKKAPSKSAPAKSAPAPDALDASMELRQAIRQEIITMEDTRDVEPVDPDLVRPLVRKQYLPIFDHAVKSGEECVIEIDLCQGEESGAGVSIDGYHFIRAWMRANGKNRTPRPNHYSLLAKSFREEFMPSATHWVLSTQWIVTNGGHSGRGVALAFLPPSVEFGQNGKFVAPLNDKDDEGNEVKFCLADSEQGQSLLSDESGYYYSVCLPTGQRVVMESIPLANPDFQRVGCSWTDSSKNTPIESVDDDGNFVVSFDVPDDFTPPESLVIRLSLNAPPKSCLKMDDVRLQASMMDFLEMVPPIREFLGTLTDDVKSVLPETLLNLHKRLNHTATGYGILSKGGRPTYSDVQFWFLSYWPMIADSLNRLTKGGTLVRTESPAFLRPIDKKEKGGVKMFHILVALAVLDPDGRQRLVDYLYDVPAEPSKWDSEAMEWRANVIGTTGGATPANADQIVESLVLKGMGKNPLDAFEADSDDKYPWQLASGRVPDRWDSKQTDAESPRCEEVGEDFDKTLKACAQMIAKVTGDSSSVESAKRKTYASRKAARK